MISIQELGAIGEFIGGIVVLATLLYLALQIKQTKIAMSHSSRIGIVEAHSRWRAALYDNLTLAELLDRDNKGEPLSDAEQIQIEMLHLELFLSTVLDVFTITEGAPHSEHEYLVNILKANPSVRRQWEKQKPMMMSLMPDCVVETDKALDKDS
jgi:hypothetical protein